MQVKLNLAQEKLIFDQIQKGKYQNAEQVISEAFNLLEKKLLQTHRITLEEFCEKIEMGTSESSEARATHLNSLSNIKIIQVAAEGIKSAVWSMSCIDRLKKLKEYLRQIHPNIKIIGLNQYHKYLDFDDCWSKDNKDKNKFFNIREFATFGTPIIKLNSAKAKYLDLYGTEKRFDEYHRALIKAEFTYLVRKFEAHLYPEEQFTLYCVCKSLDLSHLTKIGCSIEKSSITQLCPESATRRQQDKYKLFNFCCSQHQAGLKITQSEIATGLKVSQGWISRLFKGESITWSEFTNFFKEFSSSSSTISLENIDNQKLRDFLF